MIQLLVANRVSLKLYGYVRYRVIFSGPGGAGRLRWDYTLQADGNDIGQLADVSGRTVAHLRKVVLDREVTIDWFRLTTYSYCLSRCCCKTGDYLAAWK